MVTGNNNVAEVVGVPSREAFLVFVSIRVHLTVILIEM